MMLRKDNWVASGLIMAVLTAGVFYAGAGTSFARFPGYCDAYARDYADSYSNPGAGILGGALAGAMGGALL